MPATNYKATRKQWFGPKKNELKKLNHYGKLIKTSYEAIVKHGACDNFQFDTTSGKQPRREMKKER